MKTLFIIEKSFMIYHGKIEYCFFFIEKKSIFRQFTLYHMKHLKITLQLNRMKTELRHDELYYCFLLPIHTNSFKFIHIKRNIFYIIS